MAVIPFALITGGSSGLGKALAILLARGGSSVAIVARNGARLAEAKAAIDAGKAGAGFVTTTQADVTDEKQIKDAFDGIVSEKGVPTHLFNCAGAANPGYVQDFSLADFEAAMRLDYFGTVVPTTTLLPHFISRGSGHVINVSSAGGFVGLIGYATYCPAKFAVMGFSEVLRHELKPKGIKVSVVCPPDMDTPGLVTENKTKPEECKILSERGKLVKPEDVAKAVVDGVGKGKYYILPGESNYIFNMKRLFPGLVFSVMDGDLRKALKKLGK